MYIFVQPEVIYSYTNLMAVIEQFKHLCHSISRARRIIVERERGWNVKNSFKRMPDYDGGIGRRSTPLWQSHGIMVWNVAGDRRCLKWSPGRLPGSYSRARKREIPVDSLFTLTRRKLRSSLVYAKIILEHHVKVI